MGHSICLIYPFAQRALKRLLRKIVAGSVRMFWGIPFWVFRYVVFKKFYYFFRSRFLEIWLLAALLSGP